MQSVIVGVAIGLFTVFLLFSLVVSGVNEAIATLLQTRSAYLLKGLRQLLENRDSKAFGAGLRSIKQSDGGAGLLDVKNVLTHPLAWSAAKPTFFTTNKRKRPPSYLDPHTFGQIAVELLAKPRTDSQMVTDVLAWADSQDKDVKKTVTAMASDKDHTNSQKVASLRSYAESQPDVVKKSLLDALYVPSIDHAMARIHDAAETLQQPLRGAVLALVDDAHGDLDRLRNNFATWFDGQMDRVSGWYKRRTFFFSVIFGVALALTCSVDVVGIARTLYTDPAARQAVVDVDPTTACAVIAASTTTTPDATTTSASPPKSDASGTKSISPDCAKTLLAGLDAQSLGLFQHHWPNDPLAWIGTIVAGFLIALGAPFWFGALSRITPLGNTGPKPSPPAASSSAPTAP